MNTESNSGEELREVPKHVTAEVNVDVMEKNLEGNGTHHVFGEDGTHLVIHERDGETSDVTVEPKFEIVEKEPQSQKAFTRFLEMFR